LKNKFYTQKELLQKTDVQVKELEQWIDLKLVRIAGKTPDNESIYEESAIEQIKKIQELKSVGFAIEDIQKIAKKVGLPLKSDQQNKKKSDHFLTVGNLAEKVNTSPRTIKHWETIGIIEADMRTEAGFRLYSDHWVYLCHLIKDLQLFGYSLDAIKKISDHFREYLAFQKDIQAHSKAEIENKTGEWNKEIEALMQKMESYKEALQRWDELLRKKKKEINTIKTQNQKRSLAKGEKNE